MRGVQRNGKKLCFLTGGSRLEPLTAFSTTSAQKTSRKFGGAMRDRTADLLDANQTLSQLSYSPMFFGISKITVF